MIKLSNGNLATGSDDNTIKIWSTEPNDLKCLNTLKGHNEAVLSLHELPNKVLISGSEGDSTLRFWDTENFKTVKVLKDPRFYQINAITHINEK